MNIWGYDLCDDPGPAGEASVDTTTDKNTIHH
jgi:hypothetical protein